MKKEFDNFTIEYTNDDLPYIDDLVQYFLLYERKIIDFFNLKTLDRKVQIKSWDDAKEFEKYIKRECQRIFHCPKEVYDWQAGQAFTTRNESQIHILSYKKRLKRKGHNSDKLDSIKKLSFMNLYIYVMHSINNIRIL